MLKNVSDIKNNKTPHIFTPPLPSGRGGVKIWGVLLFLISNIFFIMKIWFIGLSQYCMLFANECHLAVLNLELESIEL